jgi:hypothetical protein
MSLLELFVEVDDFCQEFEAWVARQQQPDKTKRGPAPSLSSSEVMSILVHFHQASYRDFKHYYQSQDSLRAVLRTRFGTPHLAAQKHEGSAHALIRPNLAAQALHH